MTINIIPSIYDLSFDGYIITSIPINEKNNVNINQHIVPSILNDAFAIIFSSSVRLDCAYLLIVLPSMLM